MVPILRNPTNLNLPSYASDVLLSLFSSYDEVALIQAFTAGLSTSLVYLVRPIRSNDGDLANVVKIDVAEQIEREVSAYQQHIEGRLPYSVHLIGNPVFSSDRIWSGIRLELVGSGYFSIQSLYDYVHYADSLNIYTLLKDRLFHGMGALWKHHHTQPELQPGLAYDSLLPPNLILKPLERSEAVINFTPDIALTQDITPGMHLQVNGFQVTKRDPVQKRLTMNLPGSSYRSSFEFKIHHPDVLSFYPGEIIDFPQQFIVRDSRASLMTRFVQGALGNQFTGQDKTVPHPNGRRLPNPLVEMPHLLQRTFDTYIARVHGDLNLQNVLVDKDIGNSFIIDFAHAQINHVLRDLLQMEMCVVTQLLAETMAEQMLSAPFITVMYEGLHTFFTQGQPLKLPTALEKPLMIIQAIRETARDHLYDKTSWHEYYTCLAICLLSSLRFDNLDQHSAAPLPKQLAYWGTAAVLDLLNKDEFRNRETSKMRYRSSNVPHTEQSAQADISLQQSEVHMPTNSKGHSDLSQAERQNALGKILRIAAQQSAKLVMYGSCLGAIALIPENSIPATLAGLAAGVGVNSLANLIERVAHSKGTSDADITVALEQAVLESNFEQIIASNHTILSEVRRLTVWQEQIKLFIQTDNDRIIELLITYNTSIVNLESEFEALVADIKKLQKALSKKSARAAKATVESSSDVLITTEKIEGDHITITGEKSTGVSPVSQGKTTIKAGDVTGKTVDITGKTTLD